jgi:hypothetical protein
MTKQSPPDGRECWHCLTNTEHAMHKRQLLWKELGHILERYSCKKCNINYFDFVEELDTLNLCNYSSCHVTYS